MELSTLIAIDEMIHQVLCWSVLHAEWFVYGIIIVACMRDLMAWIPTIVGKFRRECKNSKEMSCEAKEKIYKG